MAKGYRPPTVRAMHPLRLSEWARCTIGVGEPIPSGALGCARASGTMEAGAVGVLGVLGGALLYRSARKRLSVRWLLTIVVVGALSGLLLGRAAALAPGAQTEFIQRAAFATVFTAWWFLIREIVRRQRGDDR